MLHVYVGFSLANNARTKYVYCSESSWDRMKQQENKKVKKLLAYQMKLEVTVWKLNQTNIYVGKKVN